MDDAKETRLRLHWFPAGRFDGDFPTAFWFAGLWFYLKGFLYICYLYMLGLDPAPYPFAAKVEIWYFALAFLPAVLLGLALWNQRNKFVIPAIAFLLVDTPVLIFHVMRLTQAGFMESGLTRVLEFGSLGLNLLAIGWLIGYASHSRSR
jgi:predicted cobalt transporter CbtA